MFNSVIKRVMPVLLAMSGLFVVGVGLLIVSLTLGQLRRDRDYEAKLRPSIEFVESIERSKGRLPTDEEFANRPSAANDWMVDWMTNDSAEPAFKANGGGRNAGDFAVRVWRGEQWMIYYSWNRQFDIVDP